MITSALAAPEMPRRRSAAPALLALLLGGLCGMGLVGRLGATGLVVSQKGRAFQPGSLAVKRGETVTFVNDDSDLLHHVFIESDRFTFDSGDQEPGSRVSVSFTERGSFQVLCGIHPKMKLPVRVD